MPHLSRQAYSEAQNMKHNITTKHNKIHLHEYNKTINNLNTVKSNFK